MTTSPDYKPTADPHTQVARLPGEVWTRHALDLCGVCAVEVWVTDDRGQMLGYGLGRDEDEAIQTMVRSPTHGGRGAQSPAKRLASE